MDIYIENAVKNKLWKKILCVILSVITAFATLVTLTAGSLRLPL